MPVYGLARAAAQGRGTCIFLPNLPLCLLWCHELVTWPLWVLIFSSENENHRHPPTSSKDVVKVKGCVELKSMKGIKYNIDMCD